MWLVKWYPWRVSCLAGVLTLASTAASAQCPVLPPNTESAGHILTIKGPWRLKSAPQAELQPGCQLAPGAEITPPAPFDRDYAKIAILERSGDVRVRTCNAREDCAPSLLMPKSPPSRGGLWSAIVDEIMRKLKSDPPRYVSAITMGAGQLNDAIVQQSASGIDLSPVLRGLGAREASYELEFSRLDPVKVRWNGASGGVDAAALATGLFQVRLKGPPPSEAWVLIVGSGAMADETIKREAELRAVVGGWRDNADIEGRNAGRTLYRAFLAQAAERMNAPAQ